MAPVAASATGVTKSQEASKTIGIVQNFLSLCDPGNPKTGNRGYPACEHDEIVLHDVGHVFNVHAPRASQTHDKYSMYSIMPRTNRITPGETVFHALNRDVGRQRYLAGWPRRRFGRLGLREANLKYVCSKFLL